MRRESARRASVRELVGVLVGAAAILIYVLSCRPAWDSAGKRVAFPYVDGERSGVALCETGEMHVRRLVEEAGEALAGAQCVWSANGRWLYVLRTLGDECMRVLRVDPGDGSAETIADIEGLDDADTLYPPALVGDRWLWVSAGKRKQAPKYGAFRVDLARRRVERFFADDEKEVYIIDGGARGLFYVRGPSDGPSEFGRLEPKAPRLARLFTLPKGDTGSFPLIEPTGRRVAWFDKDAGGRRLRLTDEHGKTLNALPLVGDVEEAMFAVWTAHGIIGAAEHKPKPGSTNVGLLHVDVATGASRFVALGSEVEKEGKPLTMLQPSVSPEGSRIAVAVSDIRLSDGAAAALLIFDVGNLDAAPVRVALPPPADPR
jgi:hypothetical protein